MPFAPSVIESLLVKSGRSCCLCRKFKGTHIEVHHIVPQADGGLDDEDNGIPVCFDCHADVETYNDRHPKGRKYRPSELQKHRNLWFAIIAAGGGSGGTDHPWKSEDKDVKLIRVYAQCFDRAAFRDDFHREGSMESFDKAMEDTIAAINTGCLRSPKGTLIPRSRGKSYLVNPEWRSRMETIVETLRAIRSRYSLAIRLGQIRVSAENNGSQFYDMRDPDLGRLMNSNRADVLRLFSEICDEASIHPPSSSLLDHRRRYLDDRY